MKAKDVRIGGEYNWGGDIVEVVGMDGGKFVVESFEVGFAVVDPANLEPVVVVPFDPEFS